LGDLRLDSLQAAACGPGVSLPDEARCKVATREAARDGFQARAIGADKMEYNVAQLLRGPVGGWRQYDIDDEIRGLDPELDVIRPLTGSVTMLRTRKGILVTGVLHTVLLGTCRRCLEPTEVPAELELEEEFYSVARVGDAPVETVPEEERDDALLIDEHHILDLREVIRQSLWLAGSEDTLCRPDCKGLCPQCGENRNLGECQCDVVSSDPRWTALQALRTE
jgi:uncharacterized protein